MAVSGRMLTLMKVLYWVFLLLAHVGICYLLFSTSRVITGFIWLVAGLVIIFMMYYVYFPAGNPNATWPPYVSSCPDYLTTIGPNKCVDYVGLNSPLLKKSNPKLPPPVTDPTRVFDASGSKATKAMRALQFGLTWSGIT